MALMSRIHTLRPWVATTSSLAVVGWANSWQATVGKPLPSFVQLSPRFTETYGPNSVPAYSTFVFTMSSRQTRVLPNCGRLAATFFHVAPKSSVTKMYGLSSSERWASKVT